MAVVINPTKAIKLFNKAITRAITTKILPPIPAALIQSGITKNLSKLLDYHRTASHKIETLKADLLPY